MGTHSLTFISLFIMHFASTVTALIVGGAIAIAGDYPYPVADCQELCASFGPCANYAYATNTQGSYCKSWQNPPVCYGFYYQENDDLCFEGKEGNLECDESKPVTCPQADPCHTLCEQNEDCRTGGKTGQVQGSYCKYWQDISVCFGFYDMEDGSRVYQPEQNYPGQTFDLSHPTRCDHNDELLH